jgi:MYXO-CTERM domain-containing protein
MKYELSNLLTARLPFAFFLALTAWAGAAGAETYKVGPGERFEQVSDLADDLKPGDVVEVSGGQTYEPVHFKADGSADAPITIRGVIVDGKRPVFSGGEYTIVFDGDHYVAENLELTGGTETCLIHKGDDLTVRNALVHDCAQHGILSNDDEAGSLTIEYSEVFGCGKGEQKHQVYITSNSEAYPGAVFRLQNSYVHDGNGGNNVKSRARRNEIYYNWIEGSLYHTLDLIGPDADERYAEPREDSDVVGNVLWVTSEWQAARIGGDGTGATGGRYRFVNNTIIMAGPSEVAIRLQEEVSSLELYNNVFFKPGGGDMQLVRESEMTWVGGGSGLIGSNNWVQAGWSEVPDWPGNVRGDDPGFRDFEAGDLRPADGSPLVNAAAASVASPSGREFPTPLATALCIPPPRSLQAAGESIARANAGGADIGAFESGDGRGDAQGCASPPSNVGSGPASAPGGGGRPGGGTGTNGGGDDDGSIDGLFASGGCSAAPSPHRPSFAAGAALALGLVLASRRRRAPKTAR